MDTNTTIKIVAQGDCFLCQGEDCGTLYSIVEFVEKKCSAKSIFIDKHTVQALECADEYDLELPNDIVMLPSNTYDTIKVLMLDCVDDMYNILSEETLDVDFELEAGALYTDGVSIYRTIQIKDDRWYYDLFRIGEDFIKDNWTGSCRIDVAKSAFKPITESTYTKIKLRFEKLQQAIAQLIDQFCSRILPTNR